MICKCFPVVTALLAAWAFVTWGAETTPGAADILRSPSQTSSPPVTTPQEPLLQQTTGDNRPALEVAPSIKVKVTAFKITGNTVIDTAILQEAVAGYLGRDLDARGLAEAAGKIRRVYTDNGYFLAVAYLPKQEIKDGTVEIAVIEGRLGKINVFVAPGARISVDAVRSIVESRLKSGDVIMDSAIERPLLLIRDMPGLDAHSTINPGTELGTADLTVEVVKSGHLIDGDIDFDNFGNRYAGQDRLGITLGLNSPLSLGDRLIARFQDSPQTSESYLGSLNYTLPVGSYGMKLSASYSRLNYELARNSEFESLDAHGDADIYSVGVAYPLVRNRGFNLFARLTYDVKDTYDYLNILSTPDHKLVNGATVEFSVDYQDGLKGYSYGTLDISRDDTHLVDEISRDNDAQSGMTNGRFTKAVMSIARLQQLPANFFAFASMVVQEASQNLTPIEQFSLGGPMAVRAYPVGDAAGDDGYLYTIELRHNVPGIHPFGADVTGALFFDGGRVKVYDRPQDVKNIDFLYLSRKGPGFSLAAGAENNFLLKMSIAWPESGSPATEQNDPKTGFLRDPRVYMQVVKSF